MLEVLTTQKCTVENEPSQTQFSILLHPMYNQESKLVSSKLYCPNCGRRHVFASIEKPKHGIGEVTCGSCLANFTISGRVLSEIRKSEMPRFPKYEAPTDCDTHYFKVAIKYGSDRKSEERVVLSKDTKENFESVLFRELFCSDKYCPVHEIEKITVRENMNRVNRESEIRTPRWAEDYQGTYRFIDGIGGMKCMVMGEEQADIFSELAIIKSKYPIESSPASSTDSPIP